MVSWLNEFPVSDESKILKSLYLSPSMHLQLVIGQLPYLRYLLRKNMLQEATGKVVEILDWFNVIDGIFPNESPLLSGYEWFLVESAAIKEALEVVLRLFLPEFSTSPTVEVAQQDIQILAELYHGIESYPPFNSVVKPIAVTDFAETIEDWVIKHKATDLKKFTVAKNVFEELFTKGELTKALEDGLLRYMNQFYRVTLETLTHILQLLAIAETQEDIKQIAVILASLRAMIPSTGHLAVVKIKVEALLLQFSTLLEKLQMIPEVIPIPIEHLKTIIPAISVVSLF